MQAQKPPKTDLTGFEETSPEQLAYLERDRWPEFERELAGKCLRVLYRRGLSV